MVVISNAESYITPLQDEQNLNISRCQLNYFQKFTAVSKLTSKPGLNTRTVLPCLSL